MFLTKDYIYLFFDYPHRVLTVDSNPHHHGVVISVDPIPMTTAVFILIQSPIPRTFRGIRGTTVNIVPMQLSILECTQLIE